MATRFRKKVLRDAEWYRTPHGTAYVGDSKHLLPAIPDASVQAIITSPPFALRQKKHTGTIPSTSTSHGSRVRQGVPPRAEEMMGVSSSRSAGRGCPEPPLGRCISIACSLNWWRGGLPSCRRLLLGQPGEAAGAGQWVTVDRGRVKDAVTPIWWLSKTPTRRPITEKCSSRTARAWRSSSARATTTGSCPSGHVIGGKFGTNNGGAIPPEPHRDEQHDVEGPVSGLLS